MMRGMIVATAAVVVSAGAAHAGETVQYKPAPDWVKPAPAITPAQLTPSAPILLRLDNQQRLQGGEVWGYVETATRMASADVVTRSGTITLPWQPDQGDLIVHSVEIIRGAERIDLLAAGKRFSVLRREQQLEQLQINGTLSATMPVEGLRIGDVLRVAFSITQRDSTLGGKVQTTAILPAAPAKIGFLRARMIWPVGDAVQWKMYGQGPKPTESVAGGYREILFEGVLPKQPELPADAPARFARPTLLEATSFADWPAVSRTMAPLYATDGLIAAGSPLATELVRIKAAESDPRKRAALALDLVQDKVRYLFNGMNGGNYRPQSPADTWALRYGDCKAKTLLLLALLHGLDIEAEPVVAPAQAGDVLDGRLPIPGAFDHVIVRATIGQEVLWLDGTMSGTRLADLNDVPTFRTVLPLRTAGATLLPVPFRAPARPVMEVDMDIDQRAGVTMPPILTVTGRFRGPQAAIFGLAATQASPAETRDFVQRALGNLLGDARLAQQSIAYDPATGTATFTAKALATNRWEWSRSRERLTLVGGVGDATFEPDRARAAWKAIPVQIGAPARMLYQVRVHLPDGGRQFTLSGDQTLTDTIAGRTITRKAVLAGDLVSLDDDVATITGEIPADAVAATRARAALLQARKLEVVGPPRRISRITEVAAARKAGLLKPLLAAYDETIANDPEDRDTYLGRSHFLSGVYDFKAAIPDLTKALEIEAKVDDYVQRAWLYGVVGDDKRQRADLDEAIGLDPASARAVIALAHFQAKHAERDAALALLDERIDAGGEDATTYLQAKADILALTGDKAGAVALLDELIATDPANSDLLNSRCWIRGTLAYQLDDGLKDCNRAIEMGAGNGALDSRAMIHFRRGDFNAALTDLAAALDSYPDLPASLYLRGVVLARQGKAAEAETALLAARTAVPTIAAEYTRWGIKP